MDVFDVLPSIAGQEARARWIDVLEVIEHPIIVNLLHVPLPRCALPDLRKQEIAM